MVEQEAAYFGSDALWLIWMLDRTLLPPSSLTVRAHWQLRGTQFFMLAQSTLRCIIIMSRRDSQQARSVWLMCQLRTTLQISSQRHCLVRSLKLFAKLWVYSLLWIDYNPLSCALPYTWVPAPVHSITPGGICWHIMVVMCVNTLRIAGALFPSLGGFFPGAFYIRPFSF